MPRVSLVRIDDRLIHGQVVVKWLRYLSCKEVWIVDNQLWADDFMRNVLHLAAPPGIDVHVVPVQKAVQELQAPLNDDHSALILVKSPQTALALLDNGLTFNELNVGGLAAGPGTARLYKSVSATSEQIQVLRIIQERGVRVYFQTVPEERPIEMVDLLSKQTTA